MGKRKHRDRGERDRRAQRREERSRRRQEQIDYEAAVLFERVHPGTAASLREALLSGGVKPDDLVALDAEGFVGARKQVTGELIIPVTPSDENGADDDSTPTTG